MNAQKLQQRTLRTIINHCGLLAAALPAMIIIGAASRAIAISAIKNPETTLVFIFIFAPVWGQ